MALFGDLGKALGLEDAGDIIPLAASAAGFYFGGPTGAALGGGLGSLATGGDIKEALGTAAMAYGVSSFVSPNLMSSAAQTRGGMFGTNALQQSLYSAPTSVATTSAADQALLDKMILEPGGTPAAAESGMFGGIGDMFGAVGDFVTENPKTSAALGLGALGLAGALLGEEEEEATESRPYPTGEAFGTVYDDLGRSYSIADQGEMQQYAAELAKYQDPSYTYDTSRFIKTPEDVLANSGVFAAKGKYKNFNDEDFFRMELGQSDGGELKGPGTGTSDSIVAGIYNEDGSYEGPARLADGEFIFSAKSVRGAGNGDRDIGAARMYDMMAELEAVA